MNLLSSRPEEQFRMRVSVAGRASAAPTTYRRSGFDKLAADRRTRNETHLIQLERYTLSQDFWDA